MFKKYLTLIALSMVSVMSIALNPTPVQAAAQLQGGDFMQVFNNTTQEGTWRDPVTATSGQIIEYRITAKNIGDEPAHDVQVWGSIDGRVPQGPSNQLVITGKIANANFGGTELTDTATVNITGQAEGLRYVPGHARLNGVTDKYNCPNTCDIPDIVLGGFNVGTIQPGDFVEVTFKGGLTNTPGSTPTVTPTVAPTVTPTPGQNLQCPAGFNGTISGSNIVCVQQSQTATGGSATANATGGSVNITTTNPTTQTVSSLPKTGLPIAAWAMSGLLPVGLGFKRFGKNLSDNKNIAAYLWQEREYQKN
jgi:hypothetical protein